MNFVKSLFRRLPQIHNIAVGSLIINGNIFINSQIIYSLYIQKSDSSHILISKRFSKIFCKIENFVQAVLNTEVSWYFNCKDRYIEFGLLINFNDLFPPRIKKYLGNIVLQYVVTYLSIIPGERNMHIIPCIYCVASFRMPPMSFTTYLVIYILTYCK